MLRYFARIAVRIAVCVLVWFVPDHVLGVLGLLLTVWAMQPRPGKH